MIVTAAAERELIVSVLSAFGAPPAAADIQARWLVEADLRGVGSHSLQRLPVLVRRIEHGLILAPYVEAAADHGMIGMAITATALGRDVRGTLDADDDCNKGDVFLVADPSAFPDGSRADAVSDYLDAVRATPVRPGAAAVRVPGDRARAERARRQRAGVEIPDQVWREALELARGQPASGDAGRARRNPSAHGV